MITKTVDKVIIEKLEMREVFANTMINMAEKDERLIYMDADLMNSVKMVPFSERFPEKTINCGIQEANMVGVAAGLSAVGFIPFVHTFGTFATRRVVDQVFLSAAYAKLNVRIIGSDPGITAAFNGGTHMPFEDIGIMRGIPEVTVIEPTDSIMLKDILKQTKDAYGVYYIRLSRKKTEQIYKEGSTFTIGKAETIKDGSDVTIIATGICVADSLIAAEILNNEGISARVINMFTIKPIDKDIIINSAKDTGAIVTAENHNVINGLGSAVSEVLSENFAVPLERIGVNDEFGEVGPMDYLKERFKLTPKDIVEKAKKAILRK